MDKLNVGTKELISADLTDRLGNVADLALIPVDYKVVSEDEATTPVNWSPVANKDLMRVDVLLDTTTWAEGTYKLYVRPSIPPEVPILGPWEFELS